MQFSRKALNTRWAWTSGAAIVLLVVLNLLDGVLKAKTGFGTVSLQGIGSGWSIRMIVDHWTSPPDAVLAGFLLGLDFLFMPLYGAALFFGSLAAIDRFAPKAGRLQRILALLALAPVGAAICDALENVFELYMLTHASTDLMASLALEATAAKWLGIAIGLLLTLAALIGHLVKRRSA
jgi:hypothetical protein